MAVAGVAPSAATHRAEENEVWRTTKEEKWEAHHDKDRKEDFESGFLAGDQIWTLSQQAER